MKAILAAVFAVLIGLAFSTATFAQATPATPASPEMKKDEGKKGEKKEMKKEKKAKKAKKDEKKEEKKSSLQTRAGRDGTLCLPAFCHNLHAQPSSEHHLPIKTPVQPRSFCEIFSPSGARGTQPVHRQLLA